jgi:hypothetical protein
MKLQKEAAMKKQKLVEEENKKQVCYKERLVMDAARSCLLGGKIL